MATTTFSGPIKAGTISNTTGTTMKKANKAPPKKKQRIMKKRGNKTFFSREVRAGMINAQT